MESTSLTLLERLKDSNDHQAWNALVDNYSLFLQRILLSQGVHEQDVADICQNIVVVIHKRIGQFNHNGRTGAFRNWLRRLLATQLRSFRNDERRRRTVHYSVLESVENQLTQEDSELVRRWNSEYNHVVIESLLQVLKNRVSESALSIFRQTFIESIPPSQVARENNITVNAVLVSKSKVLQQARLVGRELLD